MWITNNRAYAVQDCGNAVTLVPAKACIPTPVLRSVLPRVSCQFAGRHDATRRDAETIRGNPRAVAVELATAASTRLDA